jgi:hypothetical protein
MPSCARAARPESIEALLGRPSPPGQRRRAVRGLRRRAARLSGEDGRPLARALGQLHGELSRHLDSEPRLAEVVAMLESARIQADEAASLLERLADDLDTDPAQLQELEAGCRACTSWRASTACRCPNSRRAATRSAPNSSACAAPASAAPLWRQSARRRWRTGARRRAR